MVFTGLQRAEYGDEWQTLERGEGQGATFKSNKIVLSLHNSVLYFSAKGTDYWGSAIAAWGGAMKEDAFVEMQRQNKITKQCLL